MKQATILMITVVFLFAARYSTAKYLLVEIDDEIHGGLIDGNGLTTDPAGI